MGNAMRSACAKFGRPAEFGARATQDRKSTRLNSSHLVISYAVFCLKKKKLNNVPASYDKQFKAFPTDLKQLPTVSFFVPSQLNDIHKHMTQKTYTWLHHILTPHSP